MLHVLPLPGVGQVAAAGRALHRQPAELPRRRGVAGLVQHRGGVAGHHPAGGAGADLVTGRGDEDVQQLGGADPVDQPHAGLLVERPPGRLGQVLPGRHAGAQAAQPLRLAGGEHGAVGGRRGEDHRHAVLGDQVGQLARGGLLHQQGRGAGAQREHHQPAEPEGERQRRRAGEQLLRAGPQHMLGERVGDRQHVPVEVHGRLGPPGGPGGEGQQRHVVGGGVAGGERRRLAFRPPNQVAGVAAAIGDQPQPGDVGALQVLGEAVVAQCQVHPGDLGDGGKLPGAQQRHGGDRHRARLEHPEPARHQPRVVRPAQQHPVARHHAEILDQDVRHPVGGLQQLAVAPPRGGGAQALPLRAVALDGAVQQLGGAVEPLRVADVGDVKAKLRPLLRGRQVVAAEGVGMR